MFDFDLVEVENVRACTKSTDMLNECILVRFHGSGARARLPPNEINTLME